MILGFEELILLSLLLLPPLVPVVALGLTRGPVVVVGEHLRCICRDRWSRKVLRLPVSHFLMRPSIASSTFRGTPPVFGLFWIIYYVEDICLVALFGPPQHLNL